jgi:hypothetical protein
VALGPAAFQGGKKTAIAGMLLHFFIAFTAALIYDTISRNCRLSSTIRYSAVSSTAAAVHLVMNRIVVPLSAAPKREFSAKAFSPN